MYHLLKPGQEWWIRLKLERDGTYACDIFLHFCWIMKYEAIHLPFPSLGFCCMSAAKVPCQRQDEPSGSDQPDESMVSYWGCLVIGGRDLIRAGSRHWVYRITMELSRFSHWANSLIYMANLSFARRQDDHFGRLRFCANVSDSPAQVQQSPGFIDSKSAWLFTMICMAKHDASYWKVATERGKHSAQILDRKSITHVYV